jgi:hypothetical protein
MTDAHRRRYRALMIVERCSRFREAIGYRQVEI